MLLAHDATHRANSDRWHNDVTYLERPPMAAVLYAEEIPEVGGDTLWANMYLAYETLSDPLRRFVSELRAVHSFAKNFTPERFAALGLEASPGRDVRPASAGLASRGTHEPADRTQSALRQSRTSPSHIEGLSPRESETLLGLLFEHMAQARVSSSLAVASGHGRACGIIAGRSTVLWPTISRHAVACDARRFSANVRFEHGCRGSRSGWGRPTWRCSSSAASSVRASFVRPRSSRSSLQRRRRSSPRGLLGGVVALCGAFVLGELGARRPDGCGAYAYLRDAFHPAVAFAYGWTALLASLTGGLAAAAVLFAGYFLSLTSLALAPGVGRGRSARGARVRQRAWPATRDVRAEWR